MQIIVNFLFREGGAHGVNLLQLNTSRSFFNKKIKTPIAFLKIKFLFFIRITHVNDRKLENVEK